MTASASAVLLFCFFVSGAAYHHINDQSISSEIQEACKATRYPESCQSSLTKSHLIPSDPNPLQIIGSSLTLSSKNLGSARSMVRAILNHSVGNLNRTTVAKTCLEALGNSGYRLRSTAAALPRGRIKDARAWASAALGYQYDCWSGLKKVNDTKMFVNTMSFMNDTVMVSTSNALSLMMSYDEFGNETRSWAPPKTERDGFWERVGSGSGSGRQLGVPKYLKADVTVCGGGGCNYATVQEAVNGAPENLRGRRRYVICVKEGVYEEIVRVPLSKRNVAFVGDGMGKTVITGSLNVGQPGLSTYDTATLGVVGDGFMARDLTVQNTAGPDVHQAVAFRSDSDTSVIENCEFLGHQDTLYVHSARQLYKSCVILGTVDFIFGNSASVFENCTLLIRPHQLNPDAGLNNFISAHSRIDPAQTTGFVFRDSLVNGTDEYMRLYRRNPNAHLSFLGRPWKEFSRTVFVECDLGEVISPPGWMSWDGEFALKTLYYGEFGNRGPGADLSRRVAWSSQIPADHVDAYSVQNFLQGDEWRM